jgi:hypothetical protein
MNLLHLPSPQFQHSQIRRYNELCTKYRAVNLAQGRFIVERRKEKTICLAKYHEALEIDQYNGYAPYTGIGASDSGHLRIARRTGRFPQLVDPRSGLNC